MKKSLVILLVVVMIFAVVFVGSSCKGDRFKKAMDDVVKAANGKAIIMFFSADD